MAACVLLIVYLHLPYTRIMSYLLIQPKTPAISYMKKKMFKMNYLFNLFGISRQIASSITRTFIPILLELYSCSSLCLNFLDHVTTFSNDYAHGWFWNQNLRKVNIVFWSLRFSY